MHSLFKVKRFPIAVHFMMSVNCNGKCIFCPQDRDQFFTNKFMPEEIFYKVIDELHRFDVGRNWNLWWSENGEGMLHPHFEEFISHARNRLPISELYLVTNMSTMTERRAEFVLNPRNNFVQLHFNIDGASPETYTACKTGLDYWKTMGNIARFISMRKSFGREDLCIFINCIGAKRYMKDVRGIDISFDDDVWRVIEAVYGMYQNVHITIQGLGFWEVKDKVLRERESDRVCLLVKPPRLMHIECFISVDGDMYSCCMDYKAQQIFGNVKDDTLFNIWNSERRYDFLNKVYNMKWAELPVCKHCIDPLQNF